MCSSLWGAIIKLYSPFDYLYITHEHTQSYQAFEIYEGILFIILAIIL